MAKIDIAIYEAQRLRSQVLSLEAALHVAEAARDQALATMADLVTELAACEAENHIYRREYRFERRIAVIACRDLAKTHDDLAACEAECCRLRSMRGDGCYTEDVEPLALVLSRSEAL